MEWYGWCYVHYEDQSSYYWVIHWFDKSHFISLANLCRLNPGIPSSEAIFSASAKAAGWVVLRITNGHSTRYIVLKVHMTKLHPRSQADSVGLAVREQRNVDTDWKSTSRAAHSNFGPSVVGVIWDIVGPDFTTYSYRNGVWFLELNEGLDGAPAKALRYCYLQWRFSGQLSDLGEVKRRKFRWRILVKQENLWNMKEKNWKIYETKKKRECPESTIWGGIPKENSMKNICVNVLITIRIIWVRWGD